MSRAAQIAGLLLLAAVILAAPAPSQGWIEPIRPVPGGGVDKVRSAVLVSVRGRVAQVTVEEWFRNSGAVMNEGSYLYPLPGEAVFANFSLWQGDQELRGETMDAAQARGIYEAIVRQRKDPALIELAGHGMIRARVFPINPGETRKITLRYTQVLDRAGDAWRFRYASGPGSGPAVPRSFRLTVDSAGRFGEPFSPTHRVTSRREGDRIQVTLADSAWTGDLELLFPLTRGLVGVSLLTHQPAGEDGFFMLLLAPGAGRSETTQRRDVVAVVDVSGSMSGEKIEQAKAALVQLLGTLHAGDRFRVVAFSSGVRRFAEGWTTVDAERRQQAQEWVRALGADGGTNIAGALTEAFAQAPAEGSLGVVVFLTDGLPSVGESDPERIAEQAERARGRFRVFAFGIGHDVNTYLLDRLAVRARGSAEYVPPGGDIERVVGAFATKVASPVLTDLTLSAGGSVELYDLQPGSLPDLFSGDEMVVFGRYRGAGSGEWSVAVRGRRNGTTEEFTTARTAGAGTEYITQLWASRKAGALSREIRLRGPNPEIVNELKQLALRFGILTEYTSYLVQEPGIVATGGVEDRMMRQRLSAPAPAAQSGAGAIARAEEQAKAASVATAADAAEMDVSLRGRSGIAPTRRVANRLFVLRDGVWTDLRHADSTHVVTVEPYSEAYFALLRALPELVKPAALEPAVVVAGGRASIKFQAGGSTTWRTGELERLVREFRS
jgi:Ca-activated chloride channel homolog